MTRAFGSAIVLLIAGCFLEPGEDTLTVRGSIVADATGAPIPDVRVELIYRPVLSPWNEPGQLLGEAATNGEGRYAIVVAPPRTQNTGSCRSLYVRASMAGYSHLDVPYPVTAIEGGCHEGETEAVTIRMQPVSE